MQEIMRGMYTRCTHACVSTAGPDSWSQTLVAEGMAEKFVGIDFADGETVFDRCAEAIQQVLQCSLNPS